MGRIFKGYSCFVVWTAALYIAFYLPRAFPGSVSIISIAIGYLFILIAAAVMSLPTFSLFIVISEMMRIRHIAFYVFAGFVAALASSWTLRFILLRREFASGLTQAGLLDLTAEQWPFLVASALGAVAYWKVSGKDAGRRHNV